MIGTSVQERLAQLQSYLEQDPHNAALLRDTARAAIEAGELDNANELFAQLRETGELTPADSNDWAVVAMRRGEPDVAAQTFAGLLEAEPDNQAVRFNLAWARALANDTEGARDLLDEGLVHALPQAAQLEVHLLHAGGQFERAAERAKAHLARHGDYPPLLAAVSVLALDVEDEALARACAEKAGEHPDALTTLGTLTLGDADPQRAKAMFEQALGIDPQSPRAWVGLGLTDLVVGNGAEAAAKLDKGAEMFGRHLGSWLAAGWAYLVAGDVAKARTRFEHAIGLDDTFAEAQASLAVAELLMGETTAGEKRAAVALRLDRHSFAGAFAQILLSANTEKAQQILKVALSHPIGEDGRTMADMIARMAR